MVGTREIAIDYFDFHEFEDPFPDASILDLLYVDLKDDIDAGVTKILEDAYKDKLSDERNGELRNFLNEECGFFGKSFRLSLLSNCYPCS